MSSRLPQNVVQQEHNPRPSCMTSTSSENQATSSAAVQEAFLSPLSGSNLMASNAQYASVMQRQLVLSNMMSLSMPMTSTTTSNATATAYPSASNLHQQMVIPTPLPYFSPYSLSTFPLLQPSAWPPPSFATPTQPSTSNCASPDSGISIGTPYGSIPTAMFTPFMTPSGGFNPLSGCYLGGPSAATQQQNVLMEINDEQSARKRKLNVSHRTRRDYCNLCHSTIHAEGRRSQGPRRHVLQFHVMKPLYKCKLCEYSSPYDKYHIASHARRVHGADRLKDVLVDCVAEFEGDIQYWTQRCFSTSTYESNQCDNTTSASSADPSAIKPSRRREAPIPTTRRFCSFAVEDLLADDDIDCPQKITTAEAEMGTSEGGGNVSLFMDVHQDSEASEDDRVKVTISPNHGNANVVPKRLFFSDAHGTPK